MNIERVWAIVLRHFYLSVHQIDRLFGVFYYPTMSLILWGFVTKYVSQAQDNILTSFLLGGLILWTVFESVDTDIGLSFMFDIWERNIVSVFASPITLVEYIGAFFLSGVVKVLISLAILTLIASVFYNFQLTSLGFGLALFWINLVIFGWTFGLFNLSMVLRFGSRLGPLVWSLPFLLIPISGVFYPISILPKSLQLISTAIPLSYVFEGMRSALASGHFDQNKFLIALLLNIFYFSISSLYFSWTFKAVKRNGELVKLI